MGPIRVLLVDDHTVMRAGTRRILEDEADIVVVGEAADGEEGLRLVAALDPDVIAVDVAMPGMDGVQMCRALRDLGRVSRALVLTGHDNDAYVRAMTRLGVKGYLLKSAGPEELVNAIRLVSSGAPVTSALTHNALTWSAESAQPRLTPKEAEVLAAVATGRRNHEIAEDMSLSVNTVEFHLRNVYAKLGASSRADALMRAQRLGWIEAPTSRE